LAPAFQVAPATSSRPAQPAAGCQHRPPPDADHPGRRPRRDRIRRAGRAGGEPGDGQL